MDFLLIGSFFAFIGFIYMFAWTFGLGPMSGLLLNTNLTVGDKLSTPHRVFAFVVFAFASAPILWGLNSILEPTTDKDIAKGVGFILGTICAEYCYFPIIRINVHAIFDGQLVLPKTLFGGEKNRKNQRL